MWRYHSSRVSQSAKVNVLYLNSNTLAGSYPVGRVFLTLVFKTYCIIETEDHKVLFSWLILWRDPIVLVVVCSMDHVPGWRENGHESSAR